MALGVGALHSHETSLDSCGFPCPGKDNLFCYNNPTWIGMVYLLTSLDKKQINHAMEVYLYQPYRADWANIRTVLQVSLVNLATQIIPSNKKFRTDSITLKLYWINMFFGFTCAPSKATTKMFYSRNSCMQSRGRSLCNEKSHLLPLYWLFDRDLYTGCL